MANLVPIPTTRVSNLFVRQRLLAQLQGDQLDIFRLQNQISTGRRIMLPSEDAPAAQRAMTLQRLIERKTQLRANVDAGRAVLAASDSALSDVASMLGSIRGLALGVAGTTATAQERDEAIIEVDKTIDDLLRIANTRYRGRYLFAGSQTNLQPYSRVGNAIKYSGNEKLVENFSDLDVLFATNAPGSTVFGGISEEVLGGVDLNVQLGADTLLSTLRGGQGISPKGALQISDGTNSVVVDISGAVTVGDVVRLIEENPPPGRTISATITGQGLTLQLDSLGGGSLTVGEVGSGRAARDLGILNTAGVLTNPLVGSDLDPALLKTTRLSDLLGTKARARLTFAGANNDILIEAAANGAAFSGVTVTVVDDVSAGGEYAQFTAGTLTIHIEAGATQANAVVQAINAEGTFTASLNPTDTANPLQAGNGLVTTTSTVTSGGSGTSLNQSSGLVVENGGQTHTIDVSQARTVEDLLNILNGSGAGLYASINSAGSGVNVRSRLSGGDFWIRENGGLTATQLGIRRDELNHPLDIPAIQGVDFTIVVNRGNIDADPEDDFAYLQVSLAGASTIQDVLDAINNHPQNNVANIAIQAQLTADNVFRLVDLNGRTLQVQSTTGGEAAEFLGLLAPGGTEATAPDGILTGAKIQYSDSGSVFTTLTRLRDAIAAGDINAMERAIALIDDDINRATFAQAEVGAREQALEIAKRNLEDEDVQLQSALSNQIEVDLVEAISNLTARQVSMQASLQAMANIMQLSLLDYL